MREHLSDEQKLDRLWNDLVGGHGGVPQDDVDRSIAETVHAFQALAKSPPESESQARVDRAVLAAIEQRAREPDKSPAPDDAVSAAHRNYPFGSNGNGQLADLKDVAGRRRTSAVLTGWPLKDPPLSAARSGPKFGYPSVRLRPLLSWLATGALVLLTLLGSLIIVDRAVTPTADPQTPVFIPALAEPPARILPPGVGEDTVLMQGTFDTVPPNATWAGIARATLAPGAEWMLGKLENDGEGPWLYRVEFGELTITADGPISVTRAGADQPVTVPAGTDVVLQTGDQGQTPSGVTSRWRNDRQVPVVVLDSGVTTVGIGDLPADVSHDAVTWTVSVPPRAPVTIAVHRLTLPAGRLLVLKDIPGLEALYLESGELEVFSAATLAIAANPLQADSASVDVLKVTAGASFHSYLTGSIPTDGGVRTIGPEPASLLVMTARDPISAEAMPMG